MRSCHFSLASSLNRRLFTAAQSLIGWEIDEETHLGAESLIKAFLASETPGNRPRVEMVKGSTMQAYTVQGTIEKTTGLCFCHFNILLDLSE